VKRLDAELFRLERPEQAERIERFERALPLDKQKLHAHVDWRGDTMRP
jgi:hypothetical protein